MRREGGRRLREKKIGKKKEGVKKAIRHVLAVPDERIDEEHFNLAVGESQENFEYTRTSLK